MKHKKKKKKEELKKKTEIDDENIWNSRKNKNETSKTYSSLFSTSND